MGQRQRVFRHGDTAAMLRKSLTLLVMAFLLPLFVASLFTSLRYWLKYRELIAANARKLAADHGADIAAIYRKQSSISYITFVRTAWANE